MQIGHHGWINVNDVIFNTYTRQTLRPSLHKNFAWKFTQLKSAALRMLGMSLVHTVEWLLSLALGLCIPHNSMDFTMEVR